MIVYVYIQYSLIQVKIIVLLEGPDPPLWGLLINSSTTGRVVWVAEENVLYIYLFRGFVSSKSC